jgi:LuxR family maltose regulon positive regulatory protein
VSQAGLFYWQARYREVIDMLKALSARCLDEGQIELLFDIDILRSASLYKLYKKDQAVKIMEQTLVRAEKGGYIRPFINYASIISPVLAEVVKSDIDKEFSSNTAAVMEACGVDASGSAPISRTGDLTPREIEVVKLLASGYTYREIADRLFVSFETVKTHVKHIYKKFNVNTKVHAIKEARQYGML